MWSSSSHVVTALPLGFALLACDVAEPPARPDGGMVGTTETYSDPSELAGLYSWSGGAYCEYFDPDGTVLGMGGAQGGRGD